MYVDEWLTAKANNEVAYVMIRDYKNRGGN